jgi:hypothetical protein
MGAALAFGTGGQIAEFVGQPGRLRGRLSKRSATDGLTRGRHQHGELEADLLRQEVVNFNVAGNGLDFACPRIAPDGMRAFVASAVAAFDLQMPEVDKAGRSASRTMAWAVSVLAGKGQWNLTPHESLRPDRQPMIQVESGRLFAHPGHRSDKLIYARSIH